MDQKMAEDPALIEVPIGEIEAKARSRLDLIRLL